MKAKNKVIFSRIIFRIIIIILIILVCVLIFFLAKQYMPKPSYPAQLDDPTPLISPI